jgi:hypothetical protein
MKWVIDKRHSSEDVERFLDMLREVVDRIKTAEVT